MDTKIKLLFSLITISLPFLLPLSVFSNNLSRKEFNACSTESNVLMIRDTNEQNDALLHALLSAYADNHDEYFGSGQESSTISFSAFESSVKVFKTNTTDRYQIYQSYINYRKFFNGTPYRSVQKACNNIGGKICHGSIHGRATSHHDAQYPWEMSVELVAYPHCFALICNSEGIELLLLSSGEAFVQRAATTSAWLSSNNFAQYNMDVSVSDIAC